MTPDADDHACEPPAANPYARTRVVDGFVVVEVVGEIDVATAEFVLEHLDAATGRPCPDILVDLRGVEFIDCSGLRVLCRELTVRAATSDWGPRQRSLSRHLALDNGHDKPCPQFRLMVQVRAHRQGRQSLGESDRDGPVHSMSPRQRAPACRGVRNRCGSRRRLRASLPSTSASSSLCLSSDGGGPAPPAPTWDDRARGRCGFGT
ncbi:STAS domain-containing protein [Streptomyces sp. NPDC050534]|uniref:STAS domain-containing protein n=1 Tax=Streptomyces sp. NPDC050534 TaxID=3365625 RepID=UPI0037A36615